MRSLCTCLAIIVTLCSAAYAFKLNGNYIDVREIGENALISLEPLPPQDPAVHSLPTVPTVPLIPTCANEGFFRDPFNCGKFYRCEREDAVPIAFYCQPGLIFNTLIESCDNPEHVEC